MVGLGLGPGSLGIWSVIFGLGILFATYEYFKVAGRKSWVVVLLLATLGIALVGLGVWYMIAIHPL